MKIPVLIAAAVLLLSGCAVHSSKPAGVQPASEQTESGAVTEAESILESANAGTEESLSEPKSAGTEEMMKLLIGETEVPVTWENNASVEALRELMPLTIQMSMYGGFEQVGPIGQSIVRDDRQTNTDYGDIVLYSGNQIVIFYGTNSWAYTKLGHIDLSQQEMRDLLSHGDAAITLE